jgi:hypothetical protein
MGYPRIGVPEVINENVSFQTVEYMQQRIEELSAENLQLKIDAASVAADERAKIVARLRYWFIDTAANAIEAGEHLK